MRSCEKVRWGGGKRGVAWGSNVFDNSSGTTSLREFAGCVYTYVRT